jgi:enoyl-[acyl-carrier protein] reductase II
VIPVEFEELLERGRRFLGSKYPIVAGAMTWISTAEFCNKLWEAGVYPMLATGNLTPEAVESEMNRVSPEVKFGVNLVVVSPHYRENLEVAVDKGAETIVFAGGFPSEEEVNFAKKGGARVFTFASSLQVAHRMISYGVDALILEGTEAGGHIGYVSTTVLIQQVLFGLRDSVPIFVAGGLGTGKMLTHTLLMGAAGVQMGTFFIMTEECPVHPRFKERFRRAKAMEALASPSFDSRLRVIPVRALYNKGTREFGKLQLDLIKKLDEKEISPQEAQLEVERFWLGALRRAVLEGDVEGGSLMAGQSVGLVKEIKPVRRAVEDLIADAEVEFERVKRLLK